MKLARDVLRTARGSRGILSFTRALEGSVRTLAKAPFQRVPETLRDLQALLGSIKRGVSPIETVVAEAREDVKMEMPHILIASWTIVLTRGDPLTSKSIPHCIGNKASRPKEVAAQLIGNVQHVFVMGPRCHEAVAPDSGVVVKRYEREYTRLDQNDFSFWSWRLQSLCQMAERTLVASGCVFHDGQPLS
jgi:hypothetical protein